YRSNGFYANVATGALLKGLANYEHNSTVVAMDSTVPADRSECSDFCSRQLASCHDLNRKLCLAIGGPWGGLIGHWWCLHLGDKDCDADRRYCERFCNYAFGPLPPPPPPEGPQPGDPCTVYANYSTETGGSDLVPFPGTLRLDEYGNCCV